MLHLAQDAFSQILDKGEALPALIVLSALLVGLVIAVFAIIAGIFKTRAREETKREIAAYVAEGSIDAETAVALLRADDDLDKCVGAVRVAMGRANAAPA